MPDPTLPRRYPYRMKLWHGVFLTTIGFGLGAAMIWIGLTDPQGPDATQPAFFIWVLAVFMLLLGVAGLYALIVARRGPTDLIVDKLGLIVPLRAGSPRTIRILFAEIQDIDFAAVYGARFLDIHYLSGKSRIAGGALPNGAFEEILELIAPRLPAHFHEEPLP